MISCADWITWGASDTALVLFDGRDGSYHALNASASLIWLAIAAGQQPEAICVGLMRDHALGRDVAEESVNGFVEAALAKGLLVRGDSI